MSGLSPLAVGCTHCGANSGVSCETRGEEFIKTFHKARRDLAAGWTEPGEESLREAVARQARELLAEIAPAGTSS